MTGPAVTVSTRPIAAGLFTTGAEPRLYAGRHRGTGRIVFPPPADATDFEEILLPRTGKLWSYTVQRFQPKTPYAGPAEFEPYAVGYVELPGAVIVEARLTGVAFDRLAIGMPMELVVVPFRTDPDGTVVTTYAFKPTAGAVS